MRALWPQGARPKLFCNPPRDVSGSVLSRRTATAPIRRQIKFSDLFTIFLAPVLATATIADTSWKEKRRRDLNRRLAEVNEEIEVLHAREVEAWSRIQSKSVRIGAWHQRRAYATAAGAVAVSDQFDEISEHQKWDALDGVTDGEIGFDTAEPFPEAWNSPQGKNDPSSEDISALRKFERLVAVRLALRMILHLQVGRSPQYRRLSTPHDYECEARTLHADLNPIIQKLQAVQQNLEAVQTPGIARLARDRQKSQAAAPEPESQRLNAHLLELSLLFRNRDITVADLVRRFGSAILDSNDVPSADAYGRLISELSRAGFSSLAYQAISSLRQSRLKLDARTIYPIITTFANNKDVRSLDRFLKSATRIDESYNFAQPWEWWLVSGVRIPVPTYQDPMLMQALVSAALQCDQPQRAEAWAILLREKDYGGPWKTHVFGNFLHYYARQRDWVQGRKWLQKSLENAPSIAPLGEPAWKQFPRLIFRMLDLCVSCDKENDYNRIIDACVVSNIPGPKTNRLLQATYTERAIDIIDDWTRLMKSRVQQSSESYPHAGDEKIMHFQSLLRDTYLSEENQAQNSKIPNPNEPSQLPRPDNDTVTKWIRVYKEHEAALFNVKSQLNEAMKLHAELQAANQSMSISIAEKQAKQRRLQEDVLADEMNNLKLEMASMKELMSKASSSSSPTLTVTKLESSASSGMERTKDVLGYLEKMNGPPKSVIRKLRLQKNLLRRERRRIGSSDPQMETALGSNSSGEGTTQELDLNDDEDAVDDEGMASLQKHSNLRRPNSRLEGLVTVRYQPQNLDKEGEVDEVFDDARKRLGRIPSQSETSDEKGHGHSKVPHLPAAMKSPVPKRDGKGLEGPTSAQEVKELHLTYQIASDKTKIRKQIHGTKSLRRKEGLASRYGQRRFRLGADDGATMPPSADVLDSRSQNHCQSG